MDYLIAIVGLLVAILSLIVAVFSSEYFRDMISEFFGWDEPKNDPKPMKKLTRNPIKKPVKLPKG